MRVAPVTIPAMTAVTFYAALAPADPGTVRCSVISPCSPARSASATTETRPAMPIRFGSLRSTETLCGTRIYRVPLFPRGSELSQVPSSLVTVLGVIRLSRVTHPGESEFS